MVAFSRTCRLCARPRAVAIASKLPDLAGETDAAVGEQDFSLADAAGVEEQLTRGGVARRVLVASAEVKPTEWDPACFAAPPRMDQALSVWQHALKSGAGQRGRGAFKASPEHERAGGDTDICHGRELQRMSAPNGHQLPYYVPVRSVT
jgi:hypothetical protein